MNEQETFRQLRPMQCLAEVRDEGVRWLAAHTVGVRLEAGAVLITQGDKSRACFFIVSGEAEVVRDGVRLGVTGPGEPEGEIALFLGTARTATTTAFTDITAYRLDAADYDLLCTSDGELALHLRVEICRHLARRFGLPSFAGVSEDGRTIGEQS